ncbi:MAG TPA: hypothetical protein VJ806_00425 [Luteimonas sp.]|nr:hypothetical protein [Luteimonas sp.]
MRVFLWFVCLMAVVASPAGFTSEAWVSNGLDGIKQAENTPREAEDAFRAKQVSAAYARSRFGALTVADRKRLSDADARWVYQGTNIASFYTAETTITHDQIAALADLERRGTASDADIKDTYRALVATRDFAAADSFKKTHKASNLPGLPTFHSELGPGFKEGPTELVVEKSGSVLIRRPAAIRSGTDIFVVAHPLCHFTQAAIRDLEADPALRQLFATHSKWIAPQGRETDFAVFDEWNKAHPDTVMTVAYKRQEWPALSDWATPVFYFMRDGKVVAKVAGWPKEGRKQELRGAAAKIGYGAGQAP